MAALDRSVQAASMGEVRVVTVCISAEMSAEEVMAEAKELLRGDTEVVFSDWISRQWAPAPGGSIDSEGKSSSAVRGAWLIALLGSRPPYDRNSRATIMMAVLGDRFR